jgi:hypothetical protein
LDCIDLDQKRPPGVSAVAVGFWLPIHLSVVYVSQTVPAQKLRAAAAQPSPRTGCEKSGLGSPRHNQFDPKVLRFLGEGADRLLRVPLREREDDIVLVAKAFLHTYGVEHAKLGLTFAPDALRALSLHRWPGNVRELQNRVQRAVIIADGKRVTARDLELTDTLSALPPQTLKAARESVEREMVLDALRRHRGKITSAALDLGISRPTLYELT